MALHTEEAPYPRCPQCGEPTLPPDTAAELEGFRARLARFGLGAGGAGESRRAAS